MQYIYQAGSSLAAGRWPLVRRSRHHHHHHHPHPSASASGDGPDGAALLDGGAGGAGGSATPTSARSAHSSELRQRRARGAGGRRGSTASTASTGTAASADADNDLQLHSGRRKRDKLEPPIFSTRKGVPLRSGALWTLVASVFLFFSVRVRSHSAVLHVLCAKQARDV
jgi:hypothetical protein